jgi:predicted  nucleic acid-binding Zn-ribbon protein
MAEITLQFLAEQQERILRELGSLRDDMSVVSATALRLDNTIDRLRSELSLEMQGVRDEMSEIRTELRAIRRQQQRTAERVRQLENEE